MFGSGCRSRPVRCGSGNARRQQAFDFLGRSLSASSDMQPGERRSVLVRFWVDEYGNVGRFEVLQSGGTAFDNEVLRALKRMPKWKPALQRGRPVATSFVQPVTFQAPEE
ncbi:MAG: TonB family protein [Hyphomicrobiales bacterium]|nr:MAG: TonB family protein [Hyphomicrobiales bacterium]